MKFSFKYLLFLSFYLHASNVIAQSFAYSITQVGFSPGQLAVQLTLLQTQSDDLVIESLVGQQIFDSATIQAGSSSATVNVAFAGLNNIRLSGSESCTNGETLEEIVEFIVEGSDCSQDVIVAGEVNQSIACSNLAIGSLNNVGIIQGDCDFDFQTSDFLWSDGYVGSANRTKLSPGRYCYTAILRGDLGGCTDCSITRCFEIDYPDLQYEITTEPLVKCFFKGYKYDRSDIIFTTPARFQFENTSSFPIYVIIGEDEIVIQPGSTHVHSTSSEEDFCYKITDYCQNTSQSACEPVEIESRSGGCYVDYPVVQAEYEFSSSETPTNMLSPDDVLSEFLSTYDMLRQAGDLDATQEGSILLESLFIDVNFSSIDNKTELSFGVGIGDPSNYYVLTASESIEELLESQSSHTSGSDSYRRDKPNILVSGTFLSIEPRECGSNEPANNVEYVITTSAGQSILSGSTDTRTVDISSLVPGVYTISVQSESCPPASSLFVLN